MCGIAAILDLGGEELPPTALSDVAAMTKVQAHRGPDGRGAVLSGPAALGHARLSVIDPLAGGQPMGSSCGWLWLSYNGEIFNYRELRAELEAKGHRFATASDTEVVLHAYEEKGPECLKDFNGQFAFVLWDGRSRTMLLARDRVGICPLHYAFSGSRLLIASEAKAILLDAGVDRSIDPVGLEQFLTWWAPLAPRTMFAGVRELPPGSYALVRRGKMRIYRWWDPDFSPVEGRSDADWAEQLAGLLDDAVRLRLRSDVPLGAYLSGGLDSSLIAARMKALDGRPPLAFCVRFADGRFDESEQQNRMAAWLGSRLVSERMGASDIAAGLPDMVWHAEKPTLRTAPVPLLRLSARVREAGVRVVLTGEGADEMLCGYGIFKEAKVREFWARCPESSLRPLLLRRLYPYLPLPRGGGEAFLRGFFGSGLANAGEPLASHRLRWAMGGFLRRFLRPESLPRAGREEMDDALLQSLPADFAAWDPVSRAQCLEIRLFLPGYLLSSQGDRMLMAHGVEGRFPFLDHRVMELAFSMPHRVRMRGLKEKRALRLAARNALPPDVVGAPKRPFRAPGINPAAGGQAQRLVAALLSRQAMETAGVLSPEPVAGLAAKARSGAALGEREVMALNAALSLQLLHGLFVEGRTTAELTAA